MQQIAANVAAGQAVYSKNVLKIYDFWVLGFSNQLLWCCPTQYLRQHFSHYASTNHLDVGVGTGYYLDKCLSAKQQRLALLDLNENSLQVAAARAARFKPELYCANVLAPLGQDIAPFNSISVNYLLHCLPGNFAEKGKMFEYLMPLLNNGAAVFGSTILGKGIQLNYAANKLMTLYQTKGIFANQEDDLSSLEHMLKHYFTDVKIDVIGCVAIFSAKKSNS